MKLILFFLTLFKIGFTQTEISFLQTSDITKVREIEHEIIKNVILSYNKKAKTKFTYKIVTVSPFPKIFEKLKKSENTDTHHIIAGMNSITNTFDRQKIFDFSITYLPAFDVVFTLKENKEASPENFKKGGYSVTYHVGTTQETAFLKIKDKFKLTALPFVKYKDRFNALLNGKVDYSIGDNVEVWDDKRLKIIYPIPSDQESGFAIIYPKGSTLKEKLDKHLKYFITSAKFKSLLKEKYSQDVSSYFRKNL